MVTGDSSISRQIYIFLDVVVKKKFPLMSLGWSQFNAMSGESEVVMEMLLVLLPVVVYSLSDRYYVWLPDHF